MKFLVDESAGLAVSQKLKQMSFDAVSAKDKRSLGFNDEVKEGCIKRSRRLFVDQRIKGF